MSKYFTSGDMELVPLDEIHLGRVKSWINNEDISSFMGPRFPVCDSSHKAWYEKCVCDVTKKKLLISVGKELVGMVSLFDIDHKNQNAEIGIYVEPESQGKGYGKRALDMMMNFAFCELNIHKIYATIYSYNPLSIKLFESVGFFREYSKKEHVYSNGDFVDIFVYSMFRRDFLA